MGQKCNPIGFRLIVTKDWRSKWYASKKEFGPLVVEDEQIRRFLKKRPQCNGAAKFVIRRMSGKVEVTIHTARPGLVIGKKGVEIDQLKKDLSRKIGKEVWIEVEEIKRPDLEAVLVAEGIASQLKRRMPFRRAMKRALQACMEAGALGVRVEVGGRLGGAEIARRERYMEGQVPLHTLRADIDYAKERAETTYGTIGVSVWINRGEDYQSKQLLGA
jgi:small subunit ribosomal protein S3